MLHAKLDEALGDATTLDAYAKAIWLHADRECGKLPDDHPAIEWFTRRYADRTGEAEEDQVVPALVATIVSFTSSVARARLPSGNGMQTGPPAP